VERFLIEHGSSLYSAFLLSSLAIVAIWEYLAARRPLHADMRTRWAGNLTLLLVNGGVMWLVYGGVGIAASITAAQYQWGLLHHIAMPAGVKVVVALLLLDLGHFGIHWGLHNVPLLWPIHRLHLDRYQLMIDEASQGVFQDTDFRRQLKIHSARSLQRILRHRMWREPIDAPHGRQL